jgi:O-antigen/teichoic acid export membrane protein
MSKQPENSSKFNTDLLWNALAFAGIVVMGILLNVLIIKFYDETALGVFNQVYAIYILLSQLAVGGVHLGIQYFVPKYAHSKNYISSFLFTALFSSLATGLVFVSLGYLSIPLIGKLLNSHNVAEGMKYTLWGLFFFSFNKIIISVHNGLRNMKTFAFFQFLRFFLMMSTLVYFIFTETNLVYLSSLLAVSEFILFFFLLFSIKEYLHLKFNNRFKKIFAIQFRYGTRALTGNFLLDINTKVDVFTLGIFMNDYWVGIYSFAATIAEGFMQLPVLFRNNINPIITKIYSKRNKALMEKVLKTNTIAFYKIIAALGIISIIGFPIIPYILQIETIFEVSVIYAVLCGGFVLSGGYQPFLMIFNQLGSPKTQTLYIFLIFISNVIFNFILVPLVGVYGAAIGTAISFIVQVFALKLILLKYFNLKIY